MRHKSIAIALSSLLLGGLSSGAQARVCTHDWHPTGPLYMVGVLVQGPQMVKLEFFGRWDEIVIYDRPGTSILYQGPPIDQFAAADNIRIRGARFTPGSMARITTNWSDAPVGCK